MSKLAAVVLAAGEGRRMGDRIKPLMHLYGTPMLLVLLEHLQACDAVGHIVVTLGRHASECAAELPDSVETVINHEWERGKTSSFQTGLATVKDWSDAVFLCPVDCPRVPCRVYHKLAGVLDGERIVIPTFRKQRGHPPLIPKKFFERYMELPADVPLNAVHRDPATPVRLVGVGSPYILDDFNVPEDVPQDTHV